MTYIIVSKQIWIILSACKIVLVCPVILAIIQCSLCMKNYLNIGVNFKSNIYLHYIDLKYMDMLRNTWER